jgi:hypothetical protein
MTCISLGKNKFLKTRKQTNMCVLTGHFRNTTLPKATGLSATIVKKKRLSSESVHVHFAENL